MSPEPKRYSRNTVSSFLHLGPHPVHFEFKWARPVKPPFLLMQRSLTTHNPCDSYKKKQCRNAAVGNAAHTWERRWRWGCRAAGGRPVWPWRLGHWGWQHCDSPPTHNPHLSPASCTDRWLTGSSDTLQGKVGLSIYKCVLCICVCVRASGLTV